MITTAELIAALSHTLPAWAWQDMYESGAVVPSSPDHIWVQGSIQNADGSYIDADVNVRGKIKGGSQVWTARVASPLIECNDGRIGPKNARPYDVAVSVALVVQSVTDRLARASARADRLVTAMKASLPDQLPPTESEFR